MILLIDCKRKQYAENYQLHTGLFKYMEDNVIRLSNNPMGFKNDYQISFEAIRDLNYDHIVMYNSGKDLLQQHLDVIEFLKDINKPKVYIGTDYFRDGFDQAEYNKIQSFDRVLFRHKASCYNNAINLPFSINPEHFKFDKKEQLPKVGFLGSAEYVNKKSPKFKFRNDLYSKRIKAINFFNDAGLARLTDLNKEKHQREKLGYTEYLNFMNENMFNLTCGGTCNFLVAKYIEIPMCNSVLVCANTVGLEDFPKNSYIEFDPDNLTDALESVKKHINSKFLRMDKIYRLKNYILDNFTHEVRSKQLLEILNKI